MKTFAELMSDFEARRQEPEADWTPFERLVGSKPAADYDAMRKHWPGSAGPLPTNEEIDAAIERHRELCRQHPDDQSDFSISLSFCMAMYAPQTWLRFFNK